METDDFSLRVDYWTNVTLPDWLDGDRTRDELEEALAEHQKVRDATIRCIERLEKKMLS